MSGRGQYIDIALLDTMVHGGIKNYQWVNRPLAVIGRVTRVDGSVVEVNIGHSVIADAIFLGLDASVREMRAAIERATEELDRVRVVTEAELRLDQERIRITVDPATGAPADRVPALVRTHRRKTTRVLVCGFRPGSVYMLEELFRSDRRHLNTDSDSEVLLNVFAHELQQQGKFSPNADDIFAAIGGVPAPMSPARYVFQFLPNVVVSAVSGAMGGSASMEVSWSWAVLTSSPSRERATLSSSATWG